MTEEPCTVGYAGYGQDLLDPPPSDPFYIGIDKHQSDNRHHVELVQLVSAVNTHYQVMGSNPHPSTIFFYLSLLFFIYFEYPFFNPGPAHGCQPFITATMSIFAFGERE
jgi:hypothetical protein